jgi:hypothetical protein
MFVLLPISTSNFLCDVWRDYFGTCFGCIYCNFFMYHSSSRYYYNKRTKFSSWEKPAELMTPLEVSYNVYFF